MSASFSVIGVEGPKAKDVVGRLFRAGPLPKAPLDLVEREFEKFNIAVIQNSVTGETGYHVLVPADEALRIRNYFVQAARGSDGLPVGLDAWNIRRVEKGLPWYGVDYDGDNFPQETRLGHTVSYTKGCFRGQETLARLENRGHVNRLLVGLAPEGSSVFPADLAGRLVEIAGLSDRLLERDYRIRAARRCGGARSSIGLPRGRSASPGHRPRERTADDKPVGDDHVFGVLVRARRSALPGVRPRRIGEGRHDAPDAAGLVKMRPVELPLPSGT